MIQGRYYIPSVSAPIWAASGFRWFCRHADANLTESTKYLGVGQVLTQPFYRTEITLYREVTSLYTGLPGRYTALTKLDDEGHKPARQPMDFTGCRRPAIRAVYSALIHHHRLTRTRTTMGAANGLCIKRK